MPTTPKTEKAKNAETVHLHYLYDRIAWNGFVRFNDPTCETRPSTHDLSQANYDALGRPDEIMVIIVPLKEGLPCPPVRKRREGS